MNSRTNKSRKYARLASMTILMVLLGCQKYSSSSTCDANASYASGTANSLSQNINYLGTITGTENNIMSVDVGVCGGTLNIPCASVTICVPGTIPPSSTNCQTINNLLLDTGSYGLRIFSSLVTISLPHVTVSGNNVGECVGYLDGSGDWGSVNSADVYLGGTSGQKAANIPIQLINSTYSGYNPSSNCAGYTVTLDTSPTSTGFNGVLGVGLFTHDCGSGCTTNSTNHQYYTCTGSTCTSSSMVLTSQVQNPVANFASGFNNGIALELPGVPASGAVSAPGYAIFGIGTVTSDGASAANNPGSSVVVYQGDTTYGDIDTTFDGTTYTDASFLDSGSNGLYFPQDSSLPSCSGSLSSFFCPCSLTNLTATFNNNLGTLSGTSASFSIADASVSFDSNNPNIVFNNLGGNLSGQFDWGLPFFLGRTVFIGINGKSATINGTLYSGPYFAF